MAFNPAIHTATNKPIGLVGKPVDARTYFYDAANFVYRAYVSEVEVKAYLNTASDRIGQFSIIINTGGSLSGGVITGGTNLEWWFKDGVADGDLVIKGNGGSAPIIANITAGDTQPVTIPYAPLTWPKAFFRNTDGTEYTGATDQDDFAGNLIITGDEGAPGTFQDTFIVIVR